MRTLTSTPAQFFAESLTHFPEQRVLFKAFNEKNDTLKLRAIRELFEQKQYDQARSRTVGVLADPDSTVEIKFWAEIQLLAIDYVETIHAGKPQSELARLHLAHAKSLQRLTKSGPKHLKFYSLVTRHAAELEILAHENFTLFMAMKQHLEAYGNPLLVVGLYARRLAVNNRFVAEYNRCLRLARYAANYQDRWVLGRALVNIVRPMGAYLVTLRAEGEAEAEQTFSHSALQICKLAAWISDETGDSEGVVLAVMGALMTTQSTESNAYRWANGVAESLIDPGLRADALLRIERARRRWKGEPVEGDYKGDTAWQIVQNIATALGIDLSDESNPLVKGLRIAARDNSPERVLACCEHIVVSQGATGPIAREIWRRFNMTTASSKVVHCTLHNFHVEGKDQDTAYAEFHRAYCASCPDHKPRPEGWRYTEQEKRLIQARHLDFVMRLEGTPFGLRHTAKD
jgi:hypothetical protein